MLAVQTKAKYEPVTGNWVLEYTDTRRVAAVAPRQVFQKWFYRLLYNKGMVVRGLGGWVVGVRAASLLVAGAARTYVTSW